MKVCMNIHTYTFVSCSPLGRQDGDSTIFSTSTTCSLSTVNQSVAAFSPSQRDLTLRLLPVHYHMHVTQVTSI